MAGVANLLGKGVVKRGRDTYSRIETRWGKWHWVISLVGGLVVREFCFGWLAGWLDRIGLDCMAGRGR